jgi:hypothetical protein
MSGKFVVSLTNAQERHRQGHRGLCRGQRRRQHPTRTPWCSCPSKACASRSPGYADDIHEEGFAALKDLMTNFVAAGGKIYVCSPCFKKRKLDEAALIPGAVIVGGAKLVEFMSEDCPSVSY